MTPLNSIIRSTLFGMQLTLHYYAFCLEHALSCLFELNQDILMQTKRVRLTVDANNEITLPNDFTNIVKLSCLWGAYEIPLIHNRHLTTLPNLDGNTQIPYAVPSSTMVDGTDAEYNFYYYVNDFGEHKGKNFGGNPTQGGGYTIARDRNKIYLAAQVKQGDIIVLEYLTKPVPATTGSPITGYEYMVNDYAVATVKAYIEWKLMQRKMNIRNRFEAQSAQQNYYNQLRILRGRMNKLTSADVKQMVNRTRRLSTK